MDQVVNNGNLYTLVPIPVWLFDAFARAQMAEGPYSLSINEFIQRLVGLDEPKGLWVYSTYSYERKTKPLKFVKVSHQVWGKVKHLQDEIRRQYGKNVPISDIMAGYVLGCLTQWDVSDICHLASKMVPKTLTTKVQVWCIYNAVGVKCLDVSPDNLLNGSELLAMWKYACESQAEE